MVVPDDLPNERPCRLRDLETVALVSGKINAGPVPGKGEVFVYRLRAHGLLALTVQISPETAQHRSGGVNRDPIAQGRETPTRILCPDPVDSLLP